MPRIIAIDWGGKRTGLAWTDPLQIIATGVGSFATPEVLGRLKEMMRTEEVERIVLGFPTRLDGTDTDSTKPVMKFKKELEKLFPLIPVTLFDERLTSKTALNAMIQGGASRKKRRNKHLINEVSATIILQEYLESGQ